MTFEELMGCHPNNPKNYNFLLKQARYHNITPFIGAGMTVWAGYPQWKALLTGLVENCGLNFREHIEDLLQSDREGRYEQAASEILNELGTGKFWRAIQTNIDREELDKHERPAYQQKLRQLFPHIWVTTNFDRSIEHLFQNKIDAVTPLNAHNGARITNALHEGKPLLLKMHGDIEDIEDVSHIVLTSDQYDKAYAPEAPMPKALKKVFERNPVLFLGCSLGPDRTMKVLKECGLQTQFAVLQFPQETANPSDIYHPDLFTPDDDEKTEWAERRIALSNQDIQCIWYPAVGDEYEGNIHDEALTALFDQLWKDCGFDDGNPGGGGGKVTAQPPEMNLPPDDIFLFRDEDVKKALDTIQRPGARCCVVGAPGIGKTALCQHVRARFGVEKIPMAALAGVNGLRAFYAAVAEAVGQELPGDIRDAEAGEAALCLLTDAHIPALYLDNFEDILHALTQDSEERAALWQWMNKLRGWRISCLISCRETLPVIGFPEQIELKPFEPKQTKALFLRYLNRKPAPAEEEKFKELIEELDGLPLAIVLVAAQARDAASLNDLAGKWYSIKQEAGTPNHDSLAIACRVTWDEIAKTPNAQLLWGMLAFGTGRMTHETRDWLGQKIKGGLTEAQGALLRAHVLRSNEERTATEMYIPLKEQFFALAEQDLKIGAALRWLGCLIPCLELAAEPSSTVGQLDAHLRALALLPDCLSILSHLCEKLPEKGLIGPLDDALFNYYQFSSSAMPVLKRLIQFYKDADDERRCAHAYFVSGDLESVFGDSKEANSLYLKAETLYRKLGHDLGLANTLRSRGDLERNYGDAKKADSLYREAETLFRKIGHDLGLANTLRSRGNLAMEQASDAKGYRTAAALYEEAKALYEKVNYPTGLSYTCAELYECYTYYLHERKKANAIREQGKALLDRVPQDVADYVRKKLRLRRCILSLKR